MSWSDDELDLLEAEQEETEFDELEGFGPMTDCGQRDRDIDLLVEAGELHQCASCGCTEATPCEGGCVWATENLCSRCV